MPSDDSINKWNLKLKSINNLTFFLVNSTFYAMADFEGTTEGAGKNSHQAYASKKLNTNIDKGNTTDTETHHSKLFDSTNKICYIRSLAIDVHAVCEKNNTIELFERGWANKMQKVKIRVPRWRVFVLMFGSICFKMFWKRLTKFCGNSSEFLTGRFIGETI